MFLLVGGLAGQVKEVIHLRKPPLSSLFYHKNFPYHHPYLHRISHKLLTKIIWDFFWRESDTLCRFLWVVITKVYASTALEGLDVT